MKILGYNITFTNKEKPIKKVVSERYSTGKSLFEDFYNGEKSHGEIGPLTKYSIDYEGFRLRSWKSYMDSEIAQTIIKKFDVWVVGTGLKLQAEPNKVILNAEKIDLPGDSFNETVESRWKMWSESTICDIKEKKNLSLIQSEANINSMVGGDVLVVLRYDNSIKQIKVELIDGALVKSPLGGTYTQDAKDKGNSIKNGIETDSKGREVAFYVCTSFMKYERISAFNGKFKVAWLYRGLEYKIENNRGIPLLAAVMQKLSVLDRYSDATLTSAEERQKIALAIEHKEFSDESSPFTDEVRRARGDNYENPIDATGEELANKVAVTTNKQVLNMSRGATIKSIESKNELYFKDFFGVHTDIICACIGIPPNIAMSKYDSNFSASRAAIKEWEHTLNVRRYYHTFYFLKPIYEFWLHIEILKNKVEAKGYTEAFKSNDFFVLQAFRNCRFVGAMVPHIDPVKEVTASRLKLGLLAENVPLSTIEQETENLNGGDSDSNIEQYGLELEMFKEKVKIEPPINNNTNP